MTLLSQFLSFFPLSVLLLTLAAFVWLLQAPGWPALLLLAAVIYLYPVLCFRLLNLFYPLREGRYNLSERRYNPWWGSHQIQLIYLACPGLESLLRLVPGLYSAWLRLWGAQIGRGVYWTPNVRIEDRPLLQLGDQVLLGHQVQIISHVIVPHKGQMRLYVKKVTIGSQAFIGAASRLGPGVTVAANAFLPVLSEGHVNQHFSASD
jgi:hypothetical protein